MDALVPVLLFALLAALLFVVERTHRRTERLSRMPFGLDLEGDRDIARTLAEVDTIRAWQPPARGAGQEQAAGCELSPTKPSPASGAVLEQATLLSPNGYRPSAKPGHGPSMTLSAKVFRIP